jgi:uncharacterized protein YcfJ
MRATFMKYLVAPAVILAVACGGKDKTAEIDAGLSNDLALASSVQPYQPQQFVSPMEQQYAQQYGYAQPIPVATRYPQQQAPVYAGSAPRRTTTRPSTGTVGTVSREPKRNTKRDAVIGAAAGAAIGQAIGRDTKGTLIGAGLGAILGGIVGHTVDVDK